MGRIKETARKVEEFDKRLAKLEKAVAALKNTRPKKSTKAAEPPEEEPVNALHRDDPQTNN